MPRKSKNKSKTNAESNEDSLLKQSDPENQSIADEDYDSTDESEDDSAFLLTEKVEDNIFKTLLKIKNKDPEIYNHEHKFFNDSDFEHDEVESKKPEKSYTYSDLVRETLLKEGAEAFEENEKVPDKVLSYIDEQDQLKKEFLEASKSIDDEDFLTKSEAVDVLPELKAPPSQDKPLREHELISKYWSTTEKLNEDEEFLKDYILNQRWREDRLENFKVDHSLEKLEEYDEEHLEKADEFEYKYNFRFEEQDGSKIIGYPRNIEDSARKPDERRRLRREKKKQRKKEEKIRRDEEIKRLKNLRKTSLEKMKEISSTAGVEVNHNLIDLDAPFDGEQHERDMKKIIGLGYDKQDDEEVDSEADPEVWWLCDDCKLGIPAGKLHFDCKLCENFTLCEACLPKTQHEHGDFTSKNVPFLCAPPDQMDNFDLDYEDYIADMPVKFKYRKVDPVPCDVQMVLEKSDKELNQVMPLRKLIGYDVPNETPFPSKGTKKSKTPKKTLTERMKKKYLKSMTKYNVNRDRLSAFGLEKKPFKNGT